MRFGVDARHEILRRFRNGEDLDFMERDKLFPLFVEASHYSACRVEC